MGSRSIRAGGTIRLRAKFKDDLQDPAQASGVYVHIFEPDADVTDLGNAFLVSGVPIYLGQGIFEYEFSTPLCGPDGLWNDLWVGELTCQTISGVMGFDVTTSGMAQQFDCQLFCNDIVQVNLTSGIQATDGTNLEEEYDAEFMTTASPAYTNIRKVRLEVGAYINTLPDMVLQLAILEASLEASVLTFAPQLTNSALFQHARREYTTCSASKGLLTNVGNLLLRSKTLADLSVTYDTNGVRNAVASLMDCMDKWEPQLIAGGGAKAATQPSHVVKGELDPDRQAVSRMWMPTDKANPGSRIPAANDRVRQQGQRRHKRTFTKPRSGKKWW